MESRKATAVWVGDRLLEKDAARANPGRDGEIAIRPMDLAEYALVAGGEDHPGWP